MYSPGGICVLECFGDSVADGREGESGVYAGIQAFNQIVAASRGQGFRKYAVGGSGVIGQYAIQISPRIVREDSKYCWLTGLNDMHTWDESAAGKAAYKAALRAALTWLSLPENAKFRAQSARVTCSGTWSNAARYGGALSKYTSTENDTATFSLSGTTLLIVTDREVSDGGSFSVTVDSVSQGTIDCTGGATDLESYAYSPQLTLVSGLADTAHTVVLTAGAGTSVLGWVAGYTTPPPGPEILLGNCLRMNATGYATYGGSDSAVTYWNGMIEDAVDELAAVGLTGITLYDASSAYDPDVAGQVQDDGIHPTAVGHYNIASAFL